MEIEIKKVSDHYEIIINNRFYCSCDNMREVDEEIAKKGNANEPEKNNAL